MIDERKKQDKELSKLAKASVISRVIAYNEFGDPIELIYQPKTNNYELQVGGEFVCEVDDEFAERYLSY